MYIYICIYILYAYIYIYIYMYIYIYFVGLQFLQDSLVGDSTPVCRGNAEALMNAFGVKPVKASTGRLDQPRGLESIEQTAYDI